MAWDQLLGMIQEAWDIDNQERSGEPAMCVSDYTPLRGGGDGSLFCPWCGLQWPRDASAWGEFPGAF